jgi:hypothetical protein
MPGRLLRLTSGSRTPTQSSIPEDEVAHDLRREKTKDRKNRISPDRMDALKRHSLSGLTGRNKSKDTRTPSRDARIPFPQTKGTSPSPALKPTKPQPNLAIKMESPPNMFYGNPTQSSGALMAGLVNLTVVDPDFVLERLDMTFVAAVTAKKPVAQNCKECSSQKTVLKEWNFLKAPKHLDAEEHSFPFSYLLPGHLPATSMGMLGVLEYYLEVRAVGVKQPGQEPETMSLRRDIPMMRALTPIPEKNSLRIFPPTNLTAHVTLAPVIHPIGDFTVLMKLNGLKDTSKDVITRWRLRKMNWKIEEKEVMVSAACSKHSAKLGGEGKGVQHEDVRTLGEEDLKEGWKSDWSDGTLEMEFAARPLGVSRPLCDVESPTGLTITHALVIELVVAEEWASVKKPEALTPTGAARVLRMQFSLMVTERAGMGISWDEEAPPVYEDVPASPPIYAADDKGKMRQPSMPQPPAIAHLSSFHSPSSSPGLHPMGGSNRAREPSALRFASTREYNGPPLDESHIEEEVSRLDLGEAGPSTAHIVDHGTRPTARSRFRMDSDDFAGTPEDDPRGPPPPPRDDD